MLSCLAQLSTRKLCYIENTVNYFLVQSVMTEEGEEWTLNRKSFPSLEGGYMWTVQTSQYPSSSVYRRHMSTGKENCDTIQK